MYDAFFHCYRHTQEISGHSDFVRATGLVNFCFLASSVRAVITATIQRGRGYYFGGDNVCGKSNAHP